LLASVVVVAVVTVDGESVLGNEDYHATLKRTISVSDVSSKCIERLNEASKKRKERKLLMITNKMERQVTECQREEEEEFMRDTRTSHGQVD
jgi:ribosome biogenesis protein Tsr3